MPMNMSTIVNKIRYKSRILKFKQFLKFFNPCKSSCLLEVGVANQEYSVLDNFLIKNYPYKKITALGIGDLSNFQEIYPEVTTVVYDGKVFPFKNKQFDIVHSNAVIEHVGNFDAQEFF
jgi:hypothetical protein